MIKFLAHETGSAAKAAHYLRRFSARNAVRPVCNPVQEESEIASAKGRVKPLERLLRCATALRVTAPLGCGSRRLVWPKGRRCPCARPGGAL